MNLTNFAVLTPLPGTDLFEEVKDRLITCNYDYFDFIHTLPPTALPLEEFYGEYCDLYKKMVSVADNPYSCKFLSHFPKA